jgi:hypothetical protein
MGAVLTVKVVDEGWDYVEVEFSTVSNQPEKKTIKLDNNMKAWLKKVGAV